jgi:repressor LexA
MKLGYSSAAASHWKKSPNPPKREALEKIASYFNVTVDYLLGKDEQPEQSNVGAVFTDGIRIVPVFESVSAGFGAYADNHVVDTIPLLIRSSHEADETICIRVTGDSMSPMIEDGDLIQVHKQDSVDSGDIAVVLLDGEEGLVKKVVYDTEFIDLISANPSYNTRHFEGEEVLRLRVVGKVKRVIRDL